MQAATLSHEVSIYVPESDDPERDNIEAVAVLESELGWIAFGVRGTALVGVVFGHTSAANAGRALCRVLGIAEGAVLIRGVLKQKVALGGSELRIVTKIADKLRRYADGESVDLRDIAIDESHLTPFGRRVTAACRRIPSGQTRTYGQLAAVCGSPGAARAVGQVMARNRFPLVVPCHRVLGAGGSLGGFSAPQGLTMKRRLLALES
jgi:methylated-DNA-[protein]-cysteine S-methyltransferase